MDLAVREFERASELDPGSMVTVVSLAAAYDGAGRTSDADATYAQAVTLAPENPLARGIRAYRDLEHGQFDTLAIDLAAVWRSTGIDSATIQSRVRRLGVPATRGAVLRESLADPGVRVSWHFQVVRHLDGDDAALAWLGTVDPDPTHSDVGSLFWCGCIGSLRHDPGFRTAMTRFGFPAEAL